MTFIDSIVFTSNLFVAILSFGLSRLSQAVHSRIHRYTYKSTTSPKTVLIIGGSFAGSWLAQRLAHSLPSGFRVVLVEKNSHLNYLFAFPRFSVKGGLEQRAFVPYDNLAKGSPNGIFEFVQGWALQVNAESVILESGVRIPYDYLAIATGALQAQPTKLRATEKKAACEELRAIQKMIKSADRIAIIGGGPVGVELATDIKSEYPEKKVVLVHSRDRLLPRFGGSLHEQVIGVLTDLGVKVILGERPQLPEIENGLLKAQKTILTWKDGKNEVFDLAIPCTGKSTTTPLLAELAPGSQSQNGQILVKPTLQILDDSLSNIFAIGDVAESGGPKMARAGLVQAELVAANICSMITGKRLKPYNPDPLEGALKLTLGKKGIMMFIEDKKGRNMIWTGKHYSEDVDATQAWKMLSADIRYCKH